MIDALLSRPLSVEFRGEAVRLRRPTIADLVAAIDAQSRGENMTAWYIAQHVLAPDNSLAYTVDQARQLHAPSAIAFVRDHVEPLYSEGLD